MDPTTATVPERRGLMASRRERSRDRDAARLRLAEELAGRAPFSIPHERGFAVRPPGDVPSAAPVIETTNGLIDSVGHDSLMSGKTKGGFLARGLLSPDSLNLDSPYLRCALDPDVVAPIAAYLGVVPVMTEIDIWYSAHGPESLKSSQLWHLDPADTLQVKVWIHCSDVGPDSGPLTILDAATSDELAGRIEYRFDDEHYRVSDEQVRDVVGEAAIQPLTGPAGTVAFVDTSACFHFGSRVGEGALPRRMVLVQYLSPYAFEFVSDHREEAPFRGLGANASSELDRLVLGAA